MIRQLDINGNPYVGVYCKANEEIALVPLNLSDSDVKIIEEVLKVDVIKTSIGGHPIIGSLVAMNSNGAIVTDFAYESELKLLRERMNVAHIPHVLNAVGNNILVNDNAALIHPKFDKKTARLISDALGVEVEKGTIASLKTVGSSAIATKKGVLCHPKAKEDELKHLKDLFKVSVNIGTVNYGMPMIGAGVIGNSKGAITGTPSTGIELGRVEEALGFLD